VEGCNGYLDFVLKLPTTRISQWVFVTYPSTLNYENIEMDGITMQFQQRKCARVRTRVTPLDLLTASLAALRDKYTILRGQPKQIASESGELFETRSFPASKLTTKQCFNVGLILSSIGAKLSHLRGEHQVFKGESFMHQTQVIWSEGDCTAKKVSSQSPQSKTT